jgi:hypothetical protein
MIKTTHRGEQEHSVEATSARLAELESKRREVLGALESACRCGDGLKMVELRRQLPELDNAIKDGKALWLGARRRDVQSRLEDLDKQVRVKQEALEQAEAKVRESGLHVARCSPGLNQGYLTGRSGALFTSSQGPGVVEYGERQRHAAAVSGELHALQTQRANVLQELGRVDRELAAWLDER